MEWSPVPQEPSPQGRAGLREARRARAEREMVRHAARALGWPFVDLAEESISCATLSRIAADLCCRYRCVPVVFNCRRVVLGVDDPWNAALIAAHARLVGLPGDRDVTFVLTTRCGLDRALDKRISRVKWRSRVPA